MTFPVGRVDFSLQAVMSRPKKHVRAELNIAGPQAKQFYGLLSAQLDAIQSELGYGLQWEDVPSRRDCRVSIYLHHADPDQQEDWSRQHHWLAARLNELHRVLAPRVSALELGPLGRSMGPPIA
jgi:hypothetical protein